MTLPTLCSPAFTGLAVMVRMFRLIPAELRSVVLSTMSSLRFKDHQIFWSVVCFQSIEMMDSLLGFQKAAQHALSYQPVLINVAITVRRRMVRGVDVDIAPFVGPASTLPVRRLLTALATHVMALDVADRLADSLHALNVARRNAGTLTTPAQAYAGRIGFIDSLRVRPVMDGIPEYLGTRVMPCKKGAAFGLGRLTAAA